MSGFVEEIVKMETNYGRPLATLLAAKLRRDGISVSALAGRLGVSQSYLSQLLTGDKPLCSAKAELLRKCSNYLEQPPVVVFLLAGKLASSDFFKSPRSLSGFLKDALQIVSESQFATDTSVGIEDLTALSGSVQLLIVYLFQSAIGEELISGRVTAGEIESAGQLHMPFSVRFRKTR